MSEARVSIIADGQAMDVPAGVSVAAALLGAGIVAFRHSVTGEPRAPLCGMGICYECRVMINGVAHRRACLVTVSEGLRVTTTFGEAGE